MKIWLHVRILQDRKKSHSSDLCLKNSVNSLNILYMDMNLLYPQNKNKYTPNIQGQVKEALLSKHEIGAHRPLLWYIPGAQFILVVLDSSNSQT